MDSHTAALTVRHLGNDRLRIEVRGHEVRADQPVGDGGEDTAPTPTELFLASLSGCVAFYAERYLRRHGLSTKGLLVACAYRWARDPARVGEVELTIEAPGLPPDRSDAFARVVAHCPIHNTLRQPPDVRIRVISPAATAR